MPTREHTDPKALDEMWHRGELLSTDSPNAPIAPSLIHRLWLWIKENLFKEPLETRDEDSEVMRRIRVHEWATRGARRLRKLDRKDSADILVVTAMLLGFEDVWAKRPRAREVRRS